MGKIIKKMTFGFIAVLCLFLCSGKVSAVTAPYLRITGANVLEVGNTIQLKAEYGALNDLISLDDPDLSPGFYGDDVTDSCTYASSDTSVATVDSTGKITGVKNGKATITIRYIGDDESTEVYNGTTTFDVYVAQHSSYNNGGPWFSDKLMDGGTNRFIVDTTRTFALGSAYSGDEIDYFVSDIDKSYISNKTNDGVTVYLDDVGDLDITVVGNVDGTYYYDTFSVIVIGDETGYYDLVITSNNNQINVGETLQLKAILHFGTTAPQNVTNDENTSYSSSNSAIATVDSNGLVKGLSSGIATITVSHLIENVGTVSETYDIKVLINAIYDADGNVDVIPENPYTGSGFIIFVSIILIASIIGIFVLSIRKIKKSDK